MEKKQIISITILSIIIIMSITFIIMTKLGLNERMSSSDGMHDDMGAIILIENDESLKYYYAGAEDLTRFGLDAEISKLKLTKSDLDSYVGVVTQGLNDSGNEFVGCKVYHYNRLPESNALLIIDNQKTYYAFCTYGPEIDLSVNDTLQDAFNKYGIPEDVREIKVYDRNDNLLNIIDDKESIFNFSGAIINSVNIGFYENNLRLVRAWQESYLNDYVYFDESTGLIIYQDVNNDFVIKEQNNSYVGISTESEGNRIPIEDIAHELWGKGSLVFTVEVNEGYQVTFNYCPVARTISVFNGAFDLSDDTINYLNNFANEQ